MRVAERIQTGTSLSHAPEGGGRPRPYSGTGGGKPRPYARIDGGAGPSLCFLARTGASALALLLALPLAFLFASPSFAAPATFDLPADLRSYAVLSCQDMQISGNPLITSEGVGGTPGRDGKAHIRSNGNVTLSGTPEVRGDVVAGPGKKVIVSGNPKITGQKLVSPTAFDCVPIDLAALKTALQQSNDNSRIPKTDRGNPGLTNGGITMSGNDGLTLPAGTYLLSNITVSGNSQIRVSGQVRILVTGSIAISGNSHLNNGGNPFQLRLWTQGPVSIASQSNIHAYFYAPNSAVALSGAMNIVGAIHTQSLALSGGVRIRRVTDDVPATVTLTSPTEGQSVPRCQVTVSGRVTDPEGPVQVKVNGVAVTVASDGTFTTTASLATADPGLVEVLATDTGGNVTRVAVRVNVVPPTVALTSPPPGSLVGTRARDLAGTSGNATTVTVNGRAAVVAGDGTWRITGFDLGPEEGLVTLALLSRHCAGEATATAVLDVDTKAPVVSIDSPRPGDLFGSSPIVVSGPIDEPHLTSLKVNGVVATIDGRRFTAEGVPLSEGDNQLKAVAIDALGRTTTSATVTVELDSTAPTVEITDPHNGDVVGTPSIVVRGEVSDLHVSSVTINGVQATISGSTFSATIALVEGDNSLIAEARDAAGHRTPSPRVVVVLDTQAPTVSIDPLPALTSAATITVTGKASDPHLATVAVNGVAATIVNGEFAASGVPLQEGSNSLVAHAVDTLGHARDSSQVTVVRDSTAPEVAITEPTPHAQLRSRTVTVRGTVADAHLRRVTVGSVQAVVEGGVGGAPATWSATVELPEGDSELVAHAEDTLDQAGESTPVPVVVDTLPPMVRLDPPAEPLVGTATVTVTGKVEEPHVESVTVGGVAATVAADGTFTATVPLSEGSNELRATARDTFDHQATSEPVVYVLDSTAPALAITSPRDGDSLTGLQVTVTGTVSDPNLLGVKVNGVDATVDSTAHTFQATVALADGANSLVAVATDRLGNRTEKSVTVTVRVVLDDQPPAITFDQPVLAGGTCLAAGASTTLGGAYGDASPSSGQNGQPPAVTVEVIDAAGVRRTYSGTLSADGTRWSVAAADLGSADGIATVLVTASDAYGNVARTSRSLRVDAAAPKVRLLLEGAPFPGAAPGATPPGGAVPTLFGRAVAASAAVEDGAAAAPPPATLTLDGAPYGAGTSIAAAGNHLLVATAADCAGHGASTHAFFTIDSTAPALLGTTPANGARVTTAVTTFSGTSDPDLASATVNGRPATVATGGAFSLSPFPGHEGRNEVSLELVDRAGNRASFQVVFEVRTVALSVQILEGGAPIAPGTVFLRPVRPEVRPSDSTAQVAATLNGAAFASGSEVSQSGTYRLVASASDGWGRSAQAEATFSVDLGAGPAIAITSPADGAVLPGLTVRVEGTVSGDGPEVAVNGVAATITGTTWSVAALPLEPEVSNTILASARDRRGRTATAGVTVRVASGGPQVLILEPVDGITTNRSAIDVAGTVVGGRARSADGTVAVQPGSGPPVTVPLATDGGFRVLDVPLATGSNTLTATVKDREGRPGTATVTVTADFTPPTLRFLADGAPLLDGASFGHSVTVAVEVADDARLEGAPRIRLNGALQAGAAAPRTEIALSANGGYLLSAIVTDAAGNETRGERSFVVGSGGCVVSEVTPAAGSAVVGAKVTLVGHAGGATSLKVRVPQPGGSAQEYTASLAEGTFLLGDVPLPTVGDNALELVCVDGSGAAQSKPHPIRRLAEGAGPTVDITAPEQGALLATDAVGVTGTVSSGAVTVNGLAATVTGTSFQRSAVPLSEGPNPLLARAVDAAGRTAEDRVVVDRDTQAPRLSITRPDNHTQVGIAGVAGGGGTPATVDVSGLVDLDAEPHLDRIVVSTAKGSVTATVDTATGVFKAPGVPLDASAGAAVGQTITATATDRAGHSGTATVEVTLDSTGPAIVLTAPADLTRIAAGGATTLAITGEAWAAPGAAVSVNGIDLDPASLSWESAGPDGRRHVAFSASVQVPTTDGAFGIIARATQLDGRWAQDRRLLFRDAVRPRVIEIVPVDGSTGVDPNALLLVLFSEPIRHDSLEGSAGLSLTRASSGQAVVGTRTVAGQAVAFAPGSALAAGEDYVFAAGAGITDVAGNPLEAPAQSHFTAATPRAAGAPTLDPLPAVLCADELTVSGHTGGGATVKVRDGNLVFTGFADVSGAFSVTIPVSGSGYHLLRVWTLDPTSAATSPESTAVVRVDCQSPSVVEARLDRGSGVVRVIFSEDMDRSTVVVGGTGAAIRLLDADVAGIYQTGTLSWPGSGIAEITLASAADAWWRNRPVRLQVGPPVADAEGNAMAATFETVFFPGGGDLSGGFLSGEVYDDATGRPLAGAEARLFASGAALPGTVAAAQEGTPVAGATTDGRGRFVLTGDVPAGRYTLVLGKEGRTRVYRRLSLRPSAALVPFDSRLTTVAAAAGEISPVAGGTVASPGSGGSGGAGGAASGPSFTIDAAALPGTLPVAVRLTTRSGQGLSDFLPLGWTPAAAVELRLEQSSGASEPPQALPEQSLWTMGAGRLELPLPAWVGAGDEIFAARYEAATGRWISLPTPALLAGSSGAPPRARVEIAGPGTVAIVVPDAEATTRPPVLPPAAGDALAGSERPATVPGLTADLTLDPPVVGPTGRARARVVARSTDGTSAWPSGLAVQAYLEEKLVLTGGGEVLEAPFAADLVLYHPELTAAERGTAAERAAGAMEFIVSPSPRAAQVLLSVGFENIRLFPFPEEVERGPLVGPDGGTVESPQGVELTIPEGALASKVPVSATLLTTAELAALPAVAGYDTKAAVRVDLSGATLARPATLSLPTPAGTASDSPASPKVILAELVEAPADGRGALPRLVARTQRAGSGAGERVVASPDLAGALPLEGIVREGLYLVLAAHQPLGFVTGFVKAGSGSPIAFSRVTADELGTGDLSSGSGRYAVAANAGANRRLQARHPTLDERGGGTVPTLAAGEVATLDLVVQPVPPRVLSVTPAAGATGVPLATSVTVLFSEALDPATVTSSTLTLELAAGDGGSSGIFVTGKVSLADRVRVVFTPARPLLPGRTFRARFAGGVADAGGAIYAGAPMLWSFSTSTTIVPGGQVHPEKFHVRVPVGGVAEIYGDPGALPGSPPGSIPWTVSPEIEGPVADPQRDSLRGNGDGSFAGTVGHPPAFAVTLASRIWVKVLDPTGTVAAEFRVGPFTTPDGLGFVAPAGEAVSFHSAQGQIVDVPAGAFTTPTLVKINSLDPATVGLPTPQGLALGGYLSLDFDGEAGETLRVHIPAPTGAANDAQVFIGTPVSLPWGKRLQLLSVGGVLERGGQRFLSNDPSLQPEPPAGTSPLTGGSQAVGKSQTLSSKAGRTCQQARQQGLPKCFLQSLLMEFTLRSQAVFYYEQGVDWALLVGHGTPFSIGIGVGQEAIFNALADMWTYVSTPHDWNGGFVLPVLSGQPLEVVRRDVATGWVLGRKPLGPVGPSDGLVDVGFLSGEDPKRPLLVDARPFQLFRFAAPEAGESLRLALEIEAATDSGGGVEVRRAGDEALEDGTSVALFDLAPTSPVDEDASPAPPIAGPSTVVCDGATAWSTGELAGSDDLLVVVGPGGLDTSSVAELELQFDQPLSDVTKRPTNEVAKLLDLGPLDGCGSSPAAGYPKPVPITLEQRDKRSRLVVVPSATLPAGHRFRLELVPTALAVETGDGQPLTYWETAPTHLEFATRDVPGDPVGGMPDGTPDLGTTRVARDLLKLGNLLLVASETGDLLAIDASNPGEAEGLRRHALENRGVRAATRSLATDGHNRIFYSGLFGSLWAIKTLRLEDVREAAAPCVDPPTWAQGLPCFNGVTGSVRIAYALGSASGSTASEFLAAGTLPEATPMDLAVLVEDEKGKTLELSAFAGVYRSGGSGLGGLTPDEEGIYTFDVELSSTLQRSQANRPEPSQPAGTPPLAIAEWRKKVCAGEEDYDRYQRVTVDNLTTGQSWSLDIENAWPDGGAGTGRAVLQGLRARAGDQLRVRYNLRAIGHAALMGSGITVVDLNRFYRLPQTGQSPGGGQCGRRLGKFEGQQIELPSCAPAGAGLTGIAMTPSVVTHSATGCENGACRGEGFIDVYSPLQRIGAVHSRSTSTAPGGVNALFPGGETADGLQLADLAACIQQVGGDSVMLRDVALGNDVEWTYRGVHGDLSGLFQGPPAGKAPQRVRGDLLFVSLGWPGVYVFDVSGRSLAQSPQGGAALVGHLRVPDHSALRLQMDAVRGVLFSGGTDATTGKPVIDVWDLASVNGAPGLEAEPKPIATLNAPWSTNQLGIDQSGTGLVYTWGAQEGAVVVPFAAPLYLFSGLYRPETASAPRGIPNEQRPTFEFPSLASPMEATPEAELADRLVNERKATAAFKLRIALPGALGPELLAKVQSLASLPGDRSLGKEDVDAADLPPAAPGWPQDEVIVRLRRIGVDAGEPGATGEGGPLGSAYHLYESVETVLLLADPRAGRGYRRQDASGATSADEAAQCRRCDWPGYLPDPAGSDPALANIKELLAGRYVRAFLFPSDEAGTATREATSRAIAFFTAHGDNYPLPTGWASTVPADEVPSPVQVSQAEPARNAALWDAGEAGVSVSLASGELLVEAMDHRVEGRALPFVLSRFYRSGLLGYGPLGSAGWTSPLFAHLREFPSSGEVEYHDGRGHVFRFLPRTLPLPAGYEADASGSYHVPKGLYLRLQKLAGGAGWRLLGRQHDVARFDSQGRLVELSDRHQKGGTAGEQGSRMQLVYDGFGRLVSVTDDLGRRYRFAYYDDPRPVAQGGDGPRFGLLRSVTDFAGRKVDYEFDEQRRLTKVKLPEVTNPVAEYAPFSYESESRPTIEYRYDPSPGGVSKDPNATGAVLHGDFAQLRLASIVLPDFVEGASGVPRARFEYEEATGRLAKVGFPRPDDPSFSVAWTFAYGNTFPAARVTVRAPWGHEVEHTLEGGRTKSQREELEVEGATGSVAEALVTTFSYADDGRLLAVTRPDGSQTSQCYGDGEGGPGCEEGGETAVDRLAKGNVVRTLTTALTQEAKGSADYDSIEVEASYQEDNLPAGLTDGEGRRIDLAVPQPAASATAKFVAENVSSRFDYDRYGRVQRSTGGGAGGPTLRLGYGADARGRSKAGLLERVEHGAAFWQQLSRDRAGNVDEVKTSQGTVERADHDSWDRPVREVFGLSEDGRFPPVGAAECSLGQGGIVERAFDAAGHVVRERRLQDYVDPADGSTKCRFVESRYRYNLREQVVAVEQSHLASPSNPGEIVAEPQQVASFQYDVHGRLEREVAEALSRPDLVTTYSYDPGGRIATVRHGEEGARRLGYDRRSRAVLATDGDAGVWRGRFDAWGRLFHEVQPTGAVVRRRFDRAGNPLQETVFDADPTTTPAAKVLADTRSEVTSFGAVSRTIEQLTAPEGTSPGETRVTERVFDASGRVREVWSGPPSEQDPTRVDRSRGRREILVDYEPQSGRLLAERFGGDGTVAPRYARTYQYATESGAPWPDVVTLLESIPGQAELVPTTSTTLRRDAMGRPIEEQRSDGSSLTSVYDRTGPTIRARSGAGTQAETSFDGRGLPIKTVRPQGRGFTLYAYDLDGTLLREGTKSGDTQPWTTSYAVDATGRVSSMTYADGTSEQLTYDPDSTVKTRRARDGVLVTLGYDAANRLRSALPSLVAAESPTRLDAGDKLAYDALSRPTVLERGRVGAGGFDPTLAVRYPSYDLSSRPASEIVGGRTAMSWRYDTWSRPVEVTLPGGVGRSDDGAFLGFARRYDSLDRLIDASGAGATALSATPIGASWAWGGADRLYAMTTKGALGTAARYGYYGGGGPQIPGGGTGSDWKLATLSWGSAGNAGPTAAPQRSWGQFGYGWRGNEGSPQDGAKLGREVLALGPGSPNLLAGMGWSWGYDGGVRMTFAAAGAGDVLGRAPPESAQAETYRYAYGAGDELERIVREATGEIAELKTGKYGRIEARNGVPFGYDGTGRRRFDDRFELEWDWRGHLVTLRVKPTWPDADGDGEPDVTPWSGHLIRFDRDALGRFTHEWHYGKLPEGTSDDAQRPFIEKRAYVWEGERLATIAAFGNAEETIFRWRILLVPGPSGLDDAPQAVVEIGDQPGNAYSGSKRTYSIVHDELGSVLGLVDEDASTDPSKPVVPLRFSYTPYGEVHAESGPELREGKHDEGKEKAVVGGTEVVQSVADERAAAKGSLVLDWSAAIDLATVGAGVKVERLVSGTGWVQLGAEEVAVGVEPEDGGISAGGGGPPTRLLVLAKNGWTRGTTYRVRLSTDLHDTIGRPLASATSLEWRIPEAPANGPIPAVGFDKKIPVRYESWEAASNTAGGRFPGGFPLLFQGLLTHRATGLVYARARIYDPRNASWLSEDPAGTVDSPSLYAFVGHAPNMGTDPMGLEEEKKPWWERAIGFFMDPLLDAVTGVVDRVPEKVRRTGDRLDQGLQRDRSAQIDADMETQPSTGWAGDAGLPHVGATTRQAGEAAAEAGRTAESGYTAAERAMLAAGTAHVVFEGGKFVVKRVAVARARRAAGEAIDAGISWGKGIQGQGLPWEDYLAASRPAGARLPAGFKTFDFFDESTGLATSAKTLDTSTAAKVADPRQVYSAIKGQVDEAASFTGYSRAGRTLTSADITARELQLAVPRTTTATQWAEIRRAIAYGEKRQVRVIITKAQ